MSVQESIMLATVVYGIAWVISFMVAFLIKGMFSAMQWMKARSQVQATPAPAPVASVPVSPAPVASGPVPTIQPSHAAR